jgi:spoIIIJ-associated protein
MSKTIIAEGKTTNEAIEKGLKELGVSKDRVEIKVLEDEKRSFFSILTPRVVKIEMTLKDVENVEKNSDKKVKKEIHISQENQEKAKNNVKEFLEDFIKNLPEGTKYTIDSDEQGLNVAISNEKLGFLIGYRGETLYALQSILSAVASKNLEQKIRVILDIEGYKAKREKTLEDLAEKVAKTVIKTRKSVTLEPMQPYERKIIHSKLQGNLRVETVSIGEEPHRKVVISLKK